MESPIEWKRVDPDDYFTVDNNDKTLIDKHHLTPVRLVYVSMILTVLSFFTKERGVKGTRQLQILWHYLNGQDIANNPIRVFIRHLGVTETLHLLPSGLRFVFPTPRSKETGKERYCLVE